MTVDRGVIIHPLSNAIFVTAPRASVVRSDLSLQFHVERARARELRHGPPATGPPPQARAGAAPSRALSRSAAVCRVPSSFIREVVQV